jgi:NAD(P)H-quinone oxidoreductase subunit 6
LLQADFLGVVQLLVYVGGILVLTLFAVMLTSRTDVRLSNRSIGGLPAVVLSGSLLTLLVLVLRRTTWATGDAAPPETTVYALGNAFLGEYILPFEVASIVLLVALIGAVVVSRKEVRG